MPQTSADKTQEDEDANDCEGDADIVERAVHGILRGMFYGIEYIYHG